MREILFKAKRIDNGEWVEGLPSYNECGEIEEIEVFSKSAYLFYEVKTDTICQYTGLNDKNGQKIWENDVIRGYLDDSYPEDATYAEVIFWKSGFYTREKGSNDVHKIDYYTEQNYEIVGNIFDNPELLSE